MRGDLARGSIRDAVGWLMERSHTGHGVVQQYFSYGGMSCLSNIFHMGEGTGHAMIKKSHARERGHEHAVLDHESSYEETTRE